ncbi:hypothetical protein NDU88_001173 [Pleurodeles waltl]|uniref:Uncharacterized protein n=1 Tax=Pleurodeles waltl TaxID=8319 RepID=A0AAV7WK32_PLEWA|nr:hypothetical protein NDU88_001173 [Pleurodeles waltl]
MAIADGQLHRDDGVRGFLRDAGLTEMRDWMVDGRLLSVSEILTDRECTVLQRMYVIRVRSFLRSRLYINPPSNESKREARVRVCIDEVSKLECSCLGSLYETTDEIKIKEGPIVMAAIFRVNHIFQTEM